MRQLKGLTDQVRKTLIDVEFPSRAVANIRDGLIADPELVSGYVIGFAFGKQIKYLPLPMCEGSDGLAVDFSAKQRNLYGNPPIDVSLTAVDLRHSVSSSCGGASL